MDKTLLTSPGLDRGGVVQESKVKVPLSLLGIPKEVRDMIYDELWEQTPRIKLPKSHAAHLDSFEICYNSEAPDDTIQAGLPQWLLCSSATMSEGLEQLFTKAKWSLFWKPNSRFNHTSCHQVWYSNVTNLALRTEQFNTFRGPTFQPPVMRLLTPWPAFIAPKQIVKTLPNLKALTLNVHHRVPKPLPSAVDTQYVVQIPWFIRFESHLTSFCIHCTSNAEFDLHAAAPSLRSAYEAEVRRIGLLLVGKEGRLTSKEVLLEDPEAKEGSESRFKLRLDVWFQKPKA